MKRFFTLLLSLFLLGISAESSAQNLDTRYSHYIFDGLIINPAYAGTTDNTSLNAFYRKQWANVEGSPQVILLSAHSPFGEQKRVGLGLTLESETLGLTSILKLNTAYSYKFEVGDGILSTGLQAGMTYYYANLANASTTDEGFDPELLNESEMDPNFGFGLYYYTDKYFVGASVPRLLKQELNGNEGLENDNETLLRESASNRIYQVTAGGIFKMSESFSLKPSFLFRSIPSAKNQQLDLTVMSIIKESFMLGVTYRSDFFGKEVNDKAFQSQSTSFMLSYQLESGLRFGYAYSLSMGATQQLGNGTHEIMLGFDIKKGDKTVFSPRYF